METWVGYGPSPEWSRGLSNGHPFDKANTRYSGRRRSCRTCERERMRRNREAARAQRRA